MTTRKHLAAGVTVERNQRGWLPWSVCLLVAAVIVIGAMVAGCGGSAPSAAGKSVPAPAASAHAGMEQEVAIVREAGATVEPGGKTVTIDGTPAVTGTYPKHGETFTVYVGTPSNQALAIYASGADNYGYVQGQGWYALITAGTDASANPVWDATPQQIAQRTGGRTVSP